MPATRQIREPNQARARARRDKILTAAETLLLKGGTKAVTTTAIALEAGVPVGSVYRYFKDRNDIVGILYDRALDTVLAAVRAALTKAEPGLGFRKTHETLSRAFWKAARTHPTFRRLTRWANARRPLWDTTPGPESGLEALVAETLRVAGVHLPDNRRGVMLRTAVVTLSVLIDQAIEEEDETVADALIDEIGILLSRYFD